MAWVNGNWVEDVPNPMQGFQTNLWGPSEAPMGSGLFNGVGGNMQSPITSPNQSGLWASPLQGKNADGSTYGGYLGAGLGVAQGLGSAYMGMKQYGLAKDQLAFQKSAYNKNYNAQRQSTNTALEDRQAARVASNAGAYDSVGNYMNKNRIA